MVSNLTVKIGADIEGLQKELQKATTGLQNFERSTSRMQNSMRGLTQSFGQLKNAAGALGMIHVAQQILRTNDEVKKLSGSWDEFLGIVGNTSAITEIADALGRVVQVMKENKDLIEGYFKMAFFVPRMLAKGVNAILPDTPDKQASPGGVMGPSAPSSQYQELWGDFWRDFQRDVEKAKEKAAELRTEVDFKKWQDKVASGPGMTETTSTKTGADFLNESGVFASWANIPSKVKQGLKEMGDGLKVSSNEFELWFAKLSATMQMAADQITIDFAPIITSALSGIGHALGSAISGSENLGQSLLRVLGGVLTQLGEMLISAGIGIESFKAALKSLNGPLAIAAGVALIALGSSIAGSIKGLGSSAGSSHSAAANTGGGAASRGDLNNRGLEIQVGGEFRIQGQDLVYIFNRQQQLNGRTRG
jgi:hypothetical protein